MDASLDTVPCLCSYAPILAGCRLPGCSLLGREGCIAPTGLPKFYVSLNHLRFGPKVTPLCELMRDDTPRWILSDCFNGQVSDDKAVLMGSFSPEPGHAWLPG